MSNSRLPAASKQPSALTTLSVAVLFAALLVGCGESETDPEQTATLIQPVAQVELHVEEEVAEDEADANGASDANGAERSGEEVYNAYCTVCHAAGVAGAPTTGNEEQWAPRMEKGVDANVESVINGLGAMPPRGGGADLSDAEIRHAVIYLFNNAGGDF